MDESHESILPTKTEVEHQIVAGIVSGRGVGGDEHDGENGDQGIPQTTQLVATTSDGRNHVVSVPVSVGSLIGTTFNVITQDQLPHFNGFLSGNTVVTDSGDLKTMHYVIHQQHTANEPLNTAAQMQQQQQQQQEQQQQQLIHVQEDDSAVSPSDQHELNSSGGAGQMSTLTWETTNGLDVLSIRCKSTTAELYKARLGSGGRGRCVKYKDQWFTPSEFENVCGRGSSKDWKRSIRYGGRSLQALIDEGILTPHATSCTCAACCDDDTTASGPVRLFTPYKRRRRNQITPDSSTRTQQASSIATTTSTNNHNCIAHQSYITTSPANKRIKIDEVKDDEEEASETELINSNVVTKDEPSWQTIAEGLDVVSQDYMETTAASTTQMIAEANLPLDRLTTLCAQMTKATNDFRRCINEAKELHVRQIEKMQEERDAALLVARAHEDGDDPNNMQHMPGIDLPPSKKCANCNREAMAECSLCRRTPYCSTFCQRKDWNAHQVECTRDPNEATQQIIMLVEEQ